MDPTIVAAVIGAAATILAAIIGLRAGKSAGREELRKEIDDAPRKYVDHLDRLIARAMKEGTEKVMVNARAIVSLRNDLRDSLMKIHDRLNSDIDTLAEQIGGPGGGQQDIGREQKAPPPRERRDRERQASTATEAVFETIQVLSRKWPGKKDQVEVELRKVLAELGLLGRSPDRPKPESK